MMLLRTGADDRGFMILKRLSAQLLHAMWRDEDPKPDWKGRKQAYLDRLPNEPPATRLISASDKLYNAKAILEDGESRGGGAMAKSFSTYPRTAR